MLRRFILFIIGFVCVSLEAQNTFTPLSVIPEPADMVVLSGSFTFTPSTVISSSSKEVLPSALFLSRYLKHYIGYSCIVRKRRKNIQKGIRLINMKNGQVSGGYQLTIKPDCIIVAGNDASGVFYGVQTLIQLLPIRTGILPSIPSLIIKDYPRFSYRGMHLDVVRHFFSVDFIKKYIDYLALHKMNYFHWHLTDDQGWRIEMKSHPELTSIGAFREGEIEGVYPGKYRSLPYGGYYTQAEIKEIIHYAAQRYITVVPEIDIPGHCMAVLATYPDFSTTPHEKKQCALTWGIFNKFNNVLAPTPEVFTFLKDVFSELCTLFPGQYIHVGGDECATRWWRNSTQTQLFMKEHKLKDEKALQSYFIRYVQKVLNANGKTLIGWDEILEGGVSSDCVIMNWRNKPSIIKEAIKKGNRIIMTPSSYTYFNIQESKQQQEIAFPGYLPLEKVYKFEILPDTLVLAAASQILGGEGCLWTEYISSPKSAEFSLFPRLSALAENLWSLPERKDWSHFMRKMRMQCLRYDLWGIRYSDHFLQEEETSTILK